MELKLQKQPVAVCELLLDATAEHPIECDILLPDYCPDIVRVLTCRAAADVTDTSVRGTTLTVEGMTTVTLCYLGDVGGARTTQVRQPFSKSFELSGEAQSPVVFASAERGYLTCRAASQRRVDVRGSLSLTTAVYDARTRRIVCDAEGGGVCLRKREYHAACLKGRTMQRFSQLEEVSPPPGGHPVKEVLRADCSPVVQEWRAVSNGVLVKGELLVSLLSLAGEDGALEAAQYSLPMSRVLETPDAASVCDVSLRCAAISCAPAEDSEAGKLSVELQLEAALLSCAETALEAAQDAFSTHYASRCESERLRTACVKTLLRERVPVRAEAPLPQGATDVTDVFAVPSQLTCAVSEEELLLTGRVSLAALVSGGEGGLQAVSETAALRVPLLSADGEKLSCRPHCAVLSAEGTISGETLILTAELLVTGAVLSFSEEDAVSDVALDETAPRERDPAIGLIIRYADAGESVWDIARQYGALPRQLMEDNGLSQDILAEDAVLVVSGA